MIYYICISFPSRSVQRSANAGERKQVLQTSRVTRFFASCFLFQNRIDGGALKHSVGVRLLFFFFFSTHRFANQIAGNGNLSWRYAPADETSLTVPNTIKKICTVRDRIVLFQGNRCTAAIDDHRQENVNETKARIFDTIVRHKTYTDERDDGLKVHQQVTRKLWLGWATQIHTFNIFADAEI